MKMRIINSLTVLMMVVLAYALLAKDLPFRSKEQATQWNFDEVSLRSSLRMPDYGQAALSAGSTLVSLNVDYISADTFVAVATKELTDYVAPTDSIRSYVCRKVSGSSIMIYAILGGVRNYSDNSTVNWLTFLKDR